MDAVQLRQKMIAYLDKFARITQVFDFPALSEDTDKLATQLRQSRYEVAFIGRVNAGKSTLLNALLGEELLPSDAVPLTPAITTFKRDEDSVQVIWNQKEKQFETETLLDGRVDTISSEQVRDALAQKFYQLNSDFRERSRIDSDAKELTLVEVHVTYPLGPKLQDVVLVDTPGMADTTNARSDVLYDYIPRADAVVMVLNALDFLQTDAKFIQQLWERERHHFFFVLNKFDLLNSDADRDKSLAHVERELQRVLGEKPDVYPTSAYLSLRLKQYQEGKLVLKEAKRKEKHLRSYDPDEYPGEWEQAAGFPPLEKDLWRFLGTSERMFAMIGLACEKIGQKMNLLQTEVQETEKLLEGEGEGDIALAVRRIEELADKVPQAQKALHYIEEGKKRVIEKIEGGRISILKRHDIAVVTSNLDPNFQEMDNHLKQVIKNCSFADLKDGKFKQELEQLWERYWANIYDEIVHLIEKYEHDAREMAELYVNETIKRIAYSLDRKLAVSPDMSGEITIINKPWLGRSVSTIAGGIASWMIPGWGDLLIMIPTVMLGQQWDEKHGKHNFNELLANLEEEADKHRNQISIHISSTFNDLKQQLESEMDRKIKEINRQLTVFQEDKERAQEVVAKAQVWLERFNPYFVQLEGEYKLIKEALTMR